MEAPSNLTATCSSTALGRDVAAAAFRLSPLALRRIDFASLGVEPAAERVRRRCLRSAGMEAGWLPAGRPRTKRRRQREADGKKQFGFRRNPLRTADSWKTFAWIWLSSALLRCSRALAERPAAWVFGDRQWARGVRKAAAASSVQSGATSGDGSGFNGQFLDSSSRRFSGYRLAEAYGNIYFAVDVSPVSARAPDDRTDPMKVADLVAIDVHTHAGSLLLRTHRRHLGALRSGGEQIFQGRQKSDHR